MSSYVANADNEAEELRDSLSEDDIEHLRADLEQLGVDAWLDWAEQNRDEANDYLRATPKQRERKKKWQEPALRRRLILCAYHQARLGASMIDAASGLGGGGSYRGMTALAASLAFQVMHDGEWRWPFLDIEPPKGWPGPHFEPYWVASGTMIPGQPSKPPEIRHGYDCT
jgi:hypothetical protein